MFSPGQFTLKAASSDQLSMLRIGLRVLTWS